MLVEFADASLKLIETDEAAITALPVAVIVDVRQRLAILRAAPDVGTLRNWRSFGLAESESEPDGHVIALAEQWSMNIQFQSADGTLKSVVMKIKRTQKVGG
jgi:plasmid maintenance system killer protein